MLYTVIFLSIFILFLSIMLVIDIGAIVDVFRNEIIICIKIFGIKILTIEISIIGLHYKLNTSKKTKNIKLILTKKDKYLISQIKSSIFDKLYFDDIVFQSKIGLKNCYYSVMLANILNTICQNFSQRLLSEPKDMRLYYENKVNFCEKQLKLALDIRVYFTIFDMIFAFILSFYKRGKYVKKAK